MKKEITLFVTLALLLSCSGKQETKAVEGNETGDTLTFLLKRPQNGYDVSVIHSKKADYVRLRQGDSLDLYCELYHLPDCLKAYEEGAKGVMEVDIDIPVVQLDTLWAEPELFFMDVNFDGKEEFVCSFEGNGWIMYNCYDLANVKTGGKSPCLISPMDEEPYNRFVLGIEPMHSGYTVFDHKKKEIFIVNSSGATCFSHTWAKYVEADSLGNPSCVKVVKEEYHNYDTESDSETIETYDSL